MNKPAEDFFNNLPSEKETEPEFNFMEAAPEKDKTPTEQVEVQPVASNEQQEEEQERKKPLRSERRAEKQNEYLTKQVQEEREARIRLEEQVKNLASQRKVEADPDIKRLLTETKDPVEATQIFESLISRARKEAEEAADARFQQRQEQGDAEVNEIHSTIESSIESIEDRYGVDLTDDTKTRNAFLDFVDSIAPEDSDALPNMNAAWQLFQRNQTASPSNTARKAQISSRSMTRSTTTRPEGKNLQPISFDAINRGSWWEKMIGNK